MGLAMSIITSLAQKAKAKGLSDEDFHLLAKPEGEHLLDHLVQMMVEAKALSADLFKVTVDYSRSLAEMVAAGKYAVGDENINPEHFPFDARHKSSADDVASAPEEVVVRLVHLGYRATDNGVRATLDLMGLRPATLPELLALGAAHPDLQKKFWIVALGSGWEKPYSDGDIMVFPFLDLSTDTDHGEIPGRHLSLDYNNEEIRWESDERFLAVRK